ncbi:MAG: hypothetical protein SPI94_05520, partial [Candidatus Onthovivens sp.]|nr:hypothetical protein [Candidatus Onthovivens sp.]
MKRLALILQRELENLLPWKIELKSKLNSINLFEFVRTWNIFDAYLTPLCLDIKKDFDVLRQSRYFKMVNHEG